MSFLNKYSTENDIFEWQLFLPDLNHLRAIDVPTHVYRHVDIQSRRKHSFRDHVSVDAWRHPSEVEVTCLTALHCHTSLANEGQVSIEICQTSNISHTLVGNKIVDHSGVVRASPIDAAPTISSFST